jgi:hypothetical protein
MGLDHQNGVISTPLNLQKVGVLSLCAAEESRCRDSLIISMIGILVDLLVWHLVSKTNRLAWLLESCSELLLFAGQRGSH